MEIQELGALGELVGGIAVIATLVYLAIQTRHYANEARRLSVNSDEGAFRFPMQLCRMTETPENVEALRSGLKDFDSLPPGIAGKFNSLMLGLFVAYRMTVARLHDGHLWVHSPSVSLVLERQKCGLRSAERDQGLGANPHPVLPRRAI